MFFEKNCILRLNLKKMRYLVAFVFLLFLRIHSSAQCMDESGNFFLKNYLQEEFGAESQNWAIVQDKRGVLYFGNNKGVLEYDGVNWRVIDIPNKSVVRSLDIDENGVIYVGAVGEFGYLKPNNNGLMQYVSLSRHLDTANNSFKEVWQTAATKQGIFFSTLKALYKFTPYYFNHPKSALVFYDTNNYNPFTIWKEANPLIGIYNINGKIISRQINKGFVTINEDKIQLIEGTEAFANLPLWTINSVSEHKVVFSIRSKGLYFLDFDKQPEERIWQSEELEKTGKNLVDSRLYFSSSLSNGYIAYATLRDGLKIMDYNGSICYVIDKNSGLAYNDVASTYYNGENLWLTTQRSIAKVEWNTPLTYWDENNGLSGIVNDVFRFKGRLFVATTQGLFYLDKSSFKEIPIVRHPTWTFQSNMNPNTGDTSLLVGSSHGVFRIIKAENNEFNVIPLISLPYIYSLYPSRYNTNNLYIGTSNGLFIYNFQQQTLSKKIAGIDEDIRGIIEDDYGNLWLSTRYTGVIRIDMANKNEIFKYNDSTKWLPSLERVQISLYEKKLIFTTQKGAFVFNNETKAFEKEAELSSYFKEDSLIIHQFYQDSKGNCWIVRNRNSNLVILYKSKDKKPIIDERTFRRFTEFTVIQSIYVEPDGKAWIGTAKGLFLYENKRNSGREIKFSTLIRKVIVGEDSAVYWGSGKNSSACNTNELKNNPVIEIDYSNNSIIFEFAATSYNPESENQFSYALQRNGKAIIWSEFSAETKKEYTNLAEGDYVFYVKSKNIYGDEGLLETFGFTIHAPWYRTYWAISFYILVAAFIFWASMRWYSRSLKRQNLKLERIIKERTSEINQQKEEIQTQKEHLEQINEQLKKLSVVASKTDNAIMVIDRQGNFEWANEGFKSMFGYSINQWKSEIGTNLLSLSTHKELQAAFSDCVGMGKSIIYTSSSITRDGREIWTQTTMTPIVNENGIVESIVAIDSDITKIIEAEQLIEKQNQEITKQRDIAILQKNEITDSIEYAKHIQSAILPSKKKLDDMLSDYFVLNRPKSIIGGDFYWAAEKENKLILAVADCTGHGVPGALMSMLGVSFLNKIVLERGFLRPDEILNRIRINVISALHQTGSAGEASDGMDIAVAVVDKTTSMLSFAGAMSPLFIIRKKTDNPKELELIRLKHDIMPIAINQKGDIEYSLKTLELQDGDRIYMFSDGYIDQFGGPRGYRFNQNNFRNLLLSIQELPMAKQALILENELEIWMDTYYQIDDILVLGIEYRNI